MTSHAPAMELLSGLALRALTTVARYDAVECINYITETLLNDGVQEFVLDAPSRRQENIMRKPAVGRESRPVIPIEHATRVPFDPVAQRLRGAFKVASKLSEHGVSGMVRHTMYQPPYDRVYHSQSDKSRA